MMNTEVKVVVFCAQILDNCVSPSNLEQKIEHLLFVQQLDDSSSSLLSSSKSHPTKNRTEKHKMVRKSKIVIGERKKNWKKL